MPPKTSLTVWTPLNHHLQIDPVKVRTTKMLNHLDSNLMIFVTFLVVLRADPDHRRRGQDGRDPDGRVHLAALVWPHNIVTLLVTLELSWSKIQMILLRIANSGRNHPCISSQSEKLSTFKPTGCPPVQETRTEPIIPCWYQIWLVPCCSPYQTVLLWNCYISH